jgi:hypothetical protein
MCAVCDSHTCTYINPYVCYMCFTMHICTGRITDAHPRPRRLKPSTPACPHNPYRPQHRAAAHEGAEIRMRGRLALHRVKQLLRSAVPKGSRGPQCRGVHVSTRSFRGQWSQLGPQPEVPVRTAPCSSGVARARSTVPVGSRAWRRLVEHAARCWSYSG